MSERRGAADVMDCLSLHIGGIVSFAKRLLAIAQTGLHTVMLLILLRCPGFEYI